MSRVRRLAIGAGVVAAAAVAIRGFLVEPFDVVASRVGLECPSVRRGELRVALFSDVAFRGEGRRERAVREAIASFRPDLVLVAGDLLERERDVEDPRILAAAASYVESLPAPCGRYVCPGEAEARDVDALARAWAGRDLVLLANAARRIDTPVGTVDLFGAAPDADALLWALRADGGRPSVFSRGRPSCRGRRLCAKAETAWPVEVDVTFAFTAGESDSYVEVGVGAGGSEGPAEGPGWALIRHEDLPDVRMYAVPPGGGTIAGRTRSGFRPPAGAWCRGRMRIRNEAAGTRVRARFWREGELEPAGWSIDALDSRPRPGALDALRLGGGPGTRRYADLRVADPAGTTLFEERFDDREAYARRWSSGSRLAEWLDGLRADTPSLLLAHNPDVVIDVADSRIAPSLVTAGHTHGGQVRLPWLGAVWPRTRIGSRYSRGFFTYEGTPLYVTAGVGTSVIPFRWGSRPEVALITLRPPLH